MMVGRCPFGRYVFLKDVSGIFGPRSGRLSMLMVQKPCTTWDVFQFL